MIKIGPTSLVHPLEMAIAAAVVGPPMFAFEANIISSKLNLKSLPKLNDTSILIKTIIAANTKMSGAF